MSKGQVTGIEDFDWGGLGKHDEAYTAEQKIELEAAYGITVNSISAHEVIEGSIVVKTKREVVVNIGYKSEGVISISEFRYDPELKEGDKAPYFNGLNQNGEEISLDKFKGKKLILHSPKSGKDKEFAYITTKIYNRLQKITHFLKNVDCFLLKKFNTSNIDSFIKTNIKKNSGFHSLLHFKRLAKTPQGEPCER